MMFLVTAVVLALSIFNSSQLLQSQSCLQAEFGIESLVLKRSQSDVTQLTLPVCGSSSLSMSLKAFEWGPSVFDLDQRLSAVLGKDSRLKYVKEIVVIADEPYAYGLNPETGSLQIGKDLFQSKGVSTWLVIFSDLVLAAREEVGVSVADQNSTQIRFAAATDLLFLLKDIFEFRDARTLSGIKWPDFDFFNFAMTSSEHCRSPWKYFFEYKTCTEGEGLEVSSLRPFLVSFLKSALVEKREFGIDYSEFQRLTTTTEFLSDLDTQSLSSTQENFLELWKRLRGELKALRSAIPDNHHARLDSAWDLYHRAYWRDGDILVDILFLLSPQDFEILKELSSVPYRVLSESHLVQLGDLMYRPRLGLRGPPEIYKGLKARYAVDLSCGGNAVGTEVVESLHKLGLKDCSQQAKLELIKSLSRQRETSLIQHLRDSSSLERR